MWFHAKVVGEFGEIKLVVFKTKQVRDLHDLVCIEAVRSDDLLGGLEFAVFERLFFDRRERSVEIARRHGITSAAAAVVVVVPVVVAVVVVVAVISRSRCCSRGLRGASHLVVDVDVHIDTADVHTHIGTTCICRSRCGCGLRNGWLSVVNHIHVFRYNWILLDGNLRKEIEFHLIRIVLVLFDFVSDIYKLCIGILEWQIILADFLQVFVFKNDFGVVIRLVQIFDTQVGLGDVIHFFAVQNEEKFVAAFRENRQMTDVSVLGESANADQQKAKGKCNFFHIQF